MCRFLTHSAVQEEELSRIPGLLRVLSKNSMTPDMEACLMQALERQMDLASTPEVVRSFARKLASVVDPVQLRLS